ncbi:alginate lyase family protein [Pedobacter riviphilus]|uniref:Alginate lyase family protein n=1 Tax=Pedobacter riviphilus TaxID=2766984 RepID=A0ABX6TD20_9SPHI|nr:alginate lyase family protein [Pedobacter riviphilus]QNR82888.1 alginate lyase family protein [Pedobacter riviphilus]
MMNKYFFILLLFILSVCFSARSQTFVHPGAPLSASDLSILKAHIRAGDYPWKQAYDVMAADGKAQLTYTYQAFATVTRSPDLNLYRWRNDMTAAFYLSLMWYFTENEAYAAKARDILIAWATTQTEFGGQLGNLDLGIMPMPMGARLLSSAAAGVVGRRRTQQP